jgi:hypothetical protein
MAADVRGSQRALQNLVARFRQRRSGAARPSRPQAPEVARLHAAMDMHELGVRLYRQRMRREHPQAARTDIDSMVKIWLAEPPSINRLRPSSKERGRDIR